MALNPTKLYIFTYLFMKFKFVFSLKDEDCLNDRNYPYVLKLFHVMQITVLLQDNAKFLFLHLGPLSQFVFPNSNYFLKYNLEIFL